MSKSSKRRPFSPFSPISRQRSRHANKLKPDEMARKVKAWMEFIKPDIKK